MKTVWVLGDQLNTSIASLQDASPDDTRVLMIESAAKVQSKRWHRQRLHLVLASMRKFAESLKSTGFEVDYRSAESLRAGVQEHRKEFDPDEIVAMEPLSWDGSELMEELGVRVVRSNQMLCHRDDFATWAGSRKTLRMEDFYRWQRSRLDYLMDGSEPAGGRWNFDADNREPPPKDGRSWEPITESKLDEIDRDVLAGLPESTFGSEPTGIWATTRRQALNRLRSFVDEVLPEFGPHEDAMLSREWRLAHSGLSHALNIGLLMPGEVVDAAEDAYRTGRVPIASAEGFIRQIIGWREYIWNVYWRYMPDYRTDNVLKAKRPLPPAFTGASTKMNCVSHALEGVEQRAYAHHIQRLMVLGNLCLIAGVDPNELVEWMWASFIDGAEWVMIPNVTGMSQYADGGRMSTKPYASGGAYINRMSDYCKGCAYDPKKRTGDDACPFTTLYWDFLDRHRARFAKNHRMFQQVRGLDRLSDLDDVKKRAAEVLEMLEAGTL